MVITIVYESTYRSSLVPRPKFFVLSEKNRPGDEASMGGTIGDKRRIKNVSNKEKALKEK